MILDALILQSKLFLNGDMGINIEDVKTDEVDINKLKLKDYTSMVGTGGSLNILIVITYEQSLLDYLMEQFLEGEEVSEDERQDYLDSVSGEVINTIIGLALPTFPNRGKGVTITPPIMINDASNISKNKNSEIISANIVTDHGEMSIGAVGSVNIIK